MKTLAASAILLAAALTTVAHGENLRYPESGDRAFVIATPDGWTHTVNRDGNLIVFNEPHTASINFKIGYLDGSLDALAAKSMPNGAPPANAGAADIGAFHGTAYDSKLITSSGVHTDVHMILVKLDSDSFLDADHFAAAILLTAEGINDDQLAAARAVLAGVTLTAPAPAEAKPPETAPAPTPPAAPEPPAPMPEATPTPDKPAATPASKP